MAYSQHHDLHSTPAPVHSTPAPPQPSQDWLYSGHGFQSSYGHTAPLQEPVPFEDFQFSFGLDPNFAIPVPLDIPPAPVTEDNTSGMLFDDSLFQNIAPPTTMNNGNTSLLNEDDQRIFTSFLDNFCMDQDVEPLPNHMPSLYDLPPSNNTSFPQQQQQEQRHDEEEERRRNSILRSLDEQKRMRHRILADAAVAAQHHQSNTPIPSSSSTTSYHHHHHHHASTMESSWASTSSHNNNGGGGGAIFLKKSDSIATPYVIPSKRSDKKKTSSPSPSPFDDHQSTRPTPARRNKPHKELLTEAEKRANHIASEQKRRTTIRTGFKDLTEIVPTLKNINNSKSTVLFKAVDYIRYLEKRTKHLHDKVQTLELRMQVEGRSMMVHPTDGATTTAAGYDDKSTIVQSERGGAITNDKVDTGNNSNSNTSHGGNNNNNSTEQALRQHSMQQKHLMQLQEELQKKLLAHHRGFTRPVQEEMDVDEEPLKATVSA